MLLKSFDQNNNRFLGKRDRQKLGYFCLIHWCEMNLNFQ